MAAFVGNTNLLELNGLKNEAAGAFVNDASVTVTIKDAEGANVSGAVWPMTMVYVEASDGDYRVALSHELPFEAKATYTALIEADSGAEAFGHWEFRFKPLTRAVSDS